MLTERQLQLVKYLQECDGYTTAGKLAEVFHVSSRSIRNDLDAVQYYLKELPVEIERTPRLGVRLIVKKGFDITSLYSSNEIKVYSREERVIIITVLLMISEKVTIEQLADKLQVSKNTVVQDLRPAEEFLKKHEVRLIKKSYYGMSLKGEEEQIRNTLFNLYIKTASEGSLNILHILRDHAEVDPEAGRNMIRRVEAAMGIRFRLFPPKVGYGDGAFTASADDGSAIYYLMDGSPEEHPYTAPVRTGKPHFYRFYSRYGTARSPYVADKSRWRTITPAVAITTSMGESAKFPYANAESYKGLSRTRRACRQQDWIRYTFSEPVRCREMYLQTGNRQLPKTIVTTGYAEVSYDGATFERAGELEMGSITLRPGRPVKAVRIVSTCDDNGTPYVTIQPPQVKPAL